MKTTVIPFRIAPLSPVVGQNEELYCGKKKCCKKYKTGKRCKKCPGRLKLKVSC